MAEKGQLPKAYLRLDPNIDAHPDLHAMVTMMLEANRQPERGRFKTLERLRLLLGKKRLQACLDREDLAVMADGRWLLAGWDEWQEGDFTVGERMERLRNRKRNAAVTGAVTPIVTGRNQPSRASGVKASGDTTTPPNPPAVAGGQGPQTKADQEATVRELVAYWRWLGRCDPRCPGGFAPQPQSIPGDRNVRAWRKSLKVGRVSVSEQKASIAARVRQELTERNVPVWEIEPWPPEEEAAPEGARRAG